MWVATLFLYTFFYFYTRRSDEIFYVALWKSCFDTYMCMKNLPLSFSYIQNFDNFVLRAQNRMLVTDCFVCMQEKNNILIDPRRDICPKRDDEKRWWIKARRKYSDDSSRRDKVTESGLNSKHIRCATQELLHEQHFSFARFQQRWSSGDWQPRYSRLYLR